MSATICAWIFQMPTMSGDDGEDAERPRRQCEAAGEDGGFCGGGICDGAGALHRAAALAFAGLWDFGEEIEEGAVNLVRRLVAGRRRGEIGRASCRERVYSSV